MGSIKLPAQKPPPYTPPYIGGDPGSPLPPPGPGMPMDCGTTAAPPVCSLVNAGTVKTVTGSIQAAINSANCGDTLEVAGGTHSEAINLNKNCPASSPLILRSRTLQGATLTTRVSMTGANNVLWGFLLSGSNSGVSLQGDSNKVIANELTGWHNVAIQMNSGQKGELAYNVFHHPGAWTAQDHQYQKSNPTVPFPLRMGIRSSHRPETFYYSANVHHNHFYEFPPKPRPEDYHSGQDDAIEVCYTGSMIQAGWLIEKNLVERHRQGHGLIDLKCGGNIVRCNTLLNSPAGRIDQRNGQGGQLIANWIEKSGGMTIKGGHHWIIGNVLTDSRLLVGAGRDPWNVTGGDSPAAFDVKLAGNKARLFVGYRYGGETIPADTIRVETNEGPIVRDLVTNYTQTGTATVPIPVAGRLGVEDVGPDALARHCGL